MKDIIAFSSSLRMTSLEISELVGSRHDSVKRTIQRLTESKVIVQPPTAFVHETDTLGRPRDIEVSVFEGAQGKRDSIVVVAQLSPEFTGRLVDRWQELEARVGAPPVLTAAETILAQAQQLVAQERSIAALQARQHETDQRLEAVEARQQAITEGFQYYTVLAYAKLNNVSVDLPLAQKLGKQAAELSRAQGVAIDRVRDPRFGQINAYQEEILNAVFSRAMAET